MDYFLVALFSGLVGTYAFYSPKVHDAVAGISISVALMPPTVMLGIAIAERDANFALASGLIIGCNVLEIYVGSFAMVICLHRMAKKRAAVQGDGR